MTLKENWTFLIMLKKETKPLGGLFVIDKETGALIVKQDFSDAIFSSPVINGNRIFFGSYDGNVYAIDLIKE